MAAKVTSFALDLDAVLCACVVSSGFGGGTPRGVVDGGDAAAGVVGGHVAGVVPVVPGGVHLHLRRLHYLLLLLCLLLLLWGCCGLGLRRFYYASYPPPLPPPPPASRPWDPQLCLAFPNVGPALDAGVVP